jgi:hypothetical protein
VSLDSEWPNDLPDCVRRYFTFALGDTAVPPRRALIRSRGTFAVRPDAWAPFRATQLICTLPPQFRWDARIRLMGMLPVRVRDSYAHGEGAMRATIARVIPILDQHGSPELAAGALQRFLAEAVWLPTALLPREGISWSAIDDRHARVTITDERTTVSLDVEFGARGEIETVAALRHRAVKGAFELTPWRGVHREYRDVDGVLIPTSGEVAWVLPDGAVPYWRGTLTDVTYDRSSKQPALPPVPPAP